ncbi:hypothetical protein diail_9667 [Diaporthe ilicicola]|nr:hypothetical protein diail_9667 [Diaporthe ilicicola]
MSPTLRLILQLALSGLGLAASIPNVVQPGQTSGALKYVGTNIAGFDFGCTTDGTCTTSKVYPPLSALGGADGAGQMQHFANDDKFNIFRLPVGWQYLVNNNLGGNLDSGNAGRYDQLVQACLATGATCIIDIHNYARWNGKIIGSSGGPTDDHFVSLWKQLATKYGSNARVVFGVMNEPHDLASVDTWAATVQKVVTAIRGVAPTSLVLIPGSSYSSAGALPTEAGPALLKVANPDGTTDNLIFDVHKYLDSDNSGTHTECVTNNIANAFQPLATWLRSNKRLAINTETGGGNTASCQKYLCEQVAFLKNNTDVFIGVVGWSAGGFDSTYELVETPTHNGNSWTDTSLVKSCLVGA